MNHFAKNLITKGWLNISALYKGFVLPYFKYVIRKKGGGSLGDGYGEARLYRDLHKIEIEEVDSIIVYVEWGKKKKKDQHIYAELVKKKIEAELIVQKLPKIKIDVEFIDQ